MGPYKYIVLEILARTREFRRTKLVHEYRELNKDVYILARILFIVILDVIYGFFSATRWRLDHPNLLNKVR
jgi:hypothetical protein